MGLSPIVAGDPVGIQLKGVDLSTAYRDQPGEGVEPDYWGLFTNRCDASGCRGWHAWARMPWEKFGGAPSSGDVWSLVFTYHGSTWEGSVR